MLVFREIFAAKQRRSRKCWKTYLIMWHNRVATDWYYISIKSALQAYIKLAHHLIFIQFLYFMCFNKCLILCLFFDCHI